MAPTTRPSETAGSGTSTSTGASDAGSAVALQSDGNIVVAGDAVSSGGKTQIAVARVMPGGTFDTSFGVQGETVAPLGGTFEIGRAVALQPDRDIVVAGTAGIMPDQNMAVVRLTPAGAFDTGFGNGGKSLVDFSTGNDAGYAVSLQSDGKILVAGDSKLGDDQRFAV